MNGYGSELARNTAYDSEGPKSLQRVSIRKEVELEIKQIEEHLEIKKRMLKLLEENPAIEQFMNLSRGIL